MAVQANSALGKEISTSTLKLTPKVDPLIKEFLKDRAQVSNLIQALGSPLNITFPDIVCKNINSFNAVYAKHNIRGKLFFAHKACQSSSLLQRMSLENIGVDVSSIHELQHALACGFPGERIEATGPKSQAFLILCIQHDLIINIDNDSELLQLLDLRKTLKSKKPIRILLRLSGFRPTNSGSYSEASRFGITPKELFPVLQQIKDHNRELEFLGFSFHLNTTTTTERVLALETCLRLIEESLQYGLEVRVLNIGGGFNVRYLEHVEEWNAYTSALKQSVLGNGAQLSWNGNTFGVKIENGRIRGDFHAHNHADANPSSNFLDDILSYETAEWGNRTLGNILSDNMIELWIEPGRALVDQCGITTATVNLLKQSTHNDLMVGLNMKRHDLVYNNKEIFIDPIILYNDSGLHNQVDAPTNISTPVYFSGSLCLATDLIYQHATFLERIPQPGDAVVFVNTAGYSMDFSASKTCMQPIARRVAVFKSKGEFAWCLDEEYSPLFALT